MLVSSTKVCCIALHCIVIQYYGEKESVKMTMTMIMMMILNITTMITA